MVVKGVNGTKEWKATSFHHAELGVNECILWKVLKFVSFCIVFAKSRVLVPER